MANLTYTTALRDQIASTLHTALYSALTTEQQFGIDGGGAVADPPAAGKAREAMLKVKRFGQYWELTDGTTVSDAAEEWFIAETVFLVSQTQRPERIQEFKDTRNQARQDYLDTISGTVITTGYSADVYAITNQALRYHVLRRVAAQDAKKALTLVPEEIDSVAYDVLTWFWNSRQWNFRRRQITISIPTTGNGAAPTINTVAGESFDSLATRNLYYSGTTRDACVWASADQMAAMKSDTSASTGKPAWFRIERSNATFSWIWHPYPDAAYTVRAEALIAMPGTTTPGVPDSATDTVPYAKIPPEFRALFKNLVLGKVMVSRGLGDDVWKQALDQLERSAPDYDDHGEMDLDGAARDVYQDAAVQPGPAYGSWRWPADVGGAM